MRRYLIHYVALYYKDDRSIKEIWSNAFIKRFSSEYDARMWTTGHIASEKPGSTIFTLEIKGL